MISEPKARCFKLIILRWMQSLNRPEANLSLTHD